MLVRDHYPVHAFLRRGQIRGSSLRRHALVITRHSLRLQLYRGATIHHVACLRCVLLLPSRLLRDIIIVRLSLRVPQLVEKELGGLIWWWLRMFLLLQLLQLLLLLLH